MIGFILTREQAEEAESAFLSAQLNYVSSQMFDLGVCQINSGDYDGMCFIPFDDSALTRKIIRDKTFQDFQEFQTIIEQLGGLDSRVNISPSDIR